MDEDQDREHRRAAVVRIRAIRLHHHVTRPVMAERLGCARSTVSIWERQMRDWRVATMCRRARILGHPLVLRVDGVAVEDGDPVVAMYGALARGDDIYYGQWVKAVLVAAHRRDGGVDLPVRSGHASRDSYRCLLGSGDDPTMRSLQRLARAVGGRCVASFTDDPLGDL